MAILFQSDWAKYPSADIHIDTKNKSFLDLALLWRDMGVKNHAFPLALVNPALKTIDPFDPELTERERVMVLYECRINPWYFYREVARAPARSGSEPGLFLANRGNMCLFWTYFNHIFITLIQPRQTGKSLSLDQLVSYLLNIRLRKSNVNLLTKDDNLRRENVKRLKDIIELLPIWMNQMGKEGSKNSENITIAKLGNNFNTFLPQSSPARANNTGRGMTTETMLFDEGPFQPLFRISYPAAVASAGAAQDIAKAKNEPYGIICTTTAGKIDDDSGNFFYNELLQTAAHWDDPFFLDSKNEEDLVRRVESMCRKSAAYTKDGKKLPPTIIPRINATFSHRQLGYSDDWLREKIAKAAGARDAAERDYLNVWTNGQANSPFSTEVTARIVESERAPNVKIYDDKHNFLLNWYVPEDRIESVMKNRDIIMGVDSSDAVGADTMGVVLVDTATYSVVASASLNNMSIFGFSEWIADLMIRYPRLVWIPETKSSGMSIIDQVSAILMSKSIDPFKRIFNRIVQERENFPEVYDELRKPMYVRGQEFYDKYKGLFGYKTSGQGEYTRNRLYGSVLSTASQRFAENIIDKVLISQLMGLSVKDGRIDHSSKGHDDQVIAWLLPGWLMLFGRNLTFYGLDPLRIFSEEPSKMAKKNVSQYERVRRTENERVENRINQLLEKLGQEKEEYVIIQMERELRYLDGLRDISDSKIENIHMLIEKAREHRLKGRRQGQHFAYNHASYDNRNSNAAYRELSNFGMGF